jgi:hypothetical protein
MRQCRLSQMIFRTSQTAGMVQLSAAISSDLVAAVVMRPIGAGRMLLFLYPTLGRSSWWKPT